MIDSSNQQVRRPKSQSSHMSQSPNEGNNNNNNNSSSSSKEKYRLRPRTLIKRLQQERGRQQPQAATAKASCGLARPKTRAAPLSKYRRKTANARERHRMLEINNAFESLRRVLPEEALQVEAASSSTTKITTLRLAASYIRALSGVLQQEDGDALCALQCTEPSSPFLRAAPAPPRHLLDYFSPAASRGSLSTTTSCSDLEDLLSDDSCSLLDHTFDVFHDIQSLPLPDPIELLLGEERDLLAFTGLCN